MLRIFDLFMFYCLVYICRSNDAIILVYICNVIIYLWNKLNHYVLIISTGSSYSYIFCYISVESSWFGAGHLEISVEQSFFLYIKKKFLDLWLNDYDFEWKTFQFLNSFEYIWNFLFIKFIHWNFMRIKFIHRKFYVAIERLCAWGLCTGIYCQTELKISTHLVSTCLEEKKMGRVCDYFFIIYYILKIH